MSSCKMLFLCNFPALHQYLTVTMIKINYEEACVEYLLIAGVGDAQCILYFFQIVCQIPFLMAKCKAGQAFALTLDLSEVILYCCSK